MMILRNFLLPILSGTLLAFTLPPFGIEFFVWFALIPFLFFLNGTKSRTQLIIGAGLTGLIYVLWLLWPLTSLNTWWFRISDPNSFWWVNREILLKIFIFFFSIYCGSLFFIIFSLIYKKFSKNLLRDAWIFPLIWVFLEFLREFGVSQFSWGHLGYIIHDNLILIQLASIFKVYGLSFLIVSINILLFLWLKNSKNYLGLKKYLNKWIITLTFIIFLPLIFGFYEINKEKRFENPVKIAVVHSSLTTTESITIESYNLYLDTLSKALKLNPEIVLMPENALPFLEINEENLIPRGHPERMGVIKPVYERLLNLSKENPETTILIGLHTYKNENDFNSIVSFEAGEITGIYQKRHILPLFEKSYDIFGKNQINPLEKAENKGVTNLESRSGLKITGLICSEISMPRLASSKNAKLIVNSSNDSVFDNELVSEQNHIMAKFRAVENRKYLLRSVKGGISSIIDPFGRVLKNSRSKEMQFISAELDI